MFSCPCAFMPLIKYILDSHGVQFFKCYTGSGSLFWNETLFCHPGNSIYFNEPWSFPDNYKVNSDNSITSKKFINKQTDPLYFFCKFRRHISRGYLFRIARSVFCFIIEEFIFTDNLNEGENNCFVFRLYNTTCNFPSVHECFDKNPVSLL